MLQEFRVLYNYHSKSSTRFAKHDVNNVYEKAMRDLRQFGIDEIGGKRVLDLGCGQRYPFALQCAANGASVTALDINYVKPDLLPTAFYRMMRHNGTKRAVKSTLRRILWDDEYYETMESAAGKPLRSYESEINFVIADPTSASYSLPSESFDLIASNAVLEHVENVPAFAAEVERLLDANGYFYAIIHNYYSLSGGHNLEWAFPDDSPPAEVPPWDHLRENRYPEWLYLNHYRPEQYKEAFAKHLQVVQFDGVGITHEPDELEGEDLLTPEIASELSQYSRELLLTRAWRIICKKV